MPDMPEIINYAQYAIIAVCLTLGKWLKTGTRLNNNLIPLVCGGTAWFLAWLGHRYIPSFPADSPGDAVQMGIMSGLASIGIHQFGKSALPALFAATTQEGKRAE